MESLRKIGMLLAVFLLAGSIFAGSVMAQPGNGKENKSPDWSNPDDVSDLIEKLNNAGDKADKIWKKLPPEAQKAVIESLKVTNVKTEIKDTGDVSILSGCKTVVLERAGYNAIGQKLWAYFQEISWCYDGTKITSKTRKRWGEVYAPYWEFVGHIYNLESGGVNQWHYRANTQGHFAFHLGDDLLEQHSYPWIDMTVYGDGSWTGTGGG